jgi:hypothetical protein
VRVEVAGDRFTTTRWAARGVDGPIRPRRRSSSSPRSRVTFSLDLTGHGIGVALLPLVRRHARLGAPVSYRNLERLLESQALRRCGR